MEEKKPYDMNSPEARQVIDEIVHGTFTIEGTFVAFPLCFPGASRPFPPDESRIVALDIAPDGMIYGGTEGHCVHLFVGMFHGVTGMVFDLAAIEDAQTCIGVHCCREAVVAVIQGNAGSRVVSVPFQPLPFDLIQEWGFTRPAVNEVYSFPEGENVIHSICESDREHLLCFTDRGVVRIQIPSGTRENIDSPQGLSSPGGFQSGEILAIGQDRNLWTYQPRSSRFEKSASQIPPDFKIGNKLCWSKGKDQGVIHVADSEGGIYHLTQKQTGTEFSEKLAQTRYYPVTAMAETFDGRLYGFCGEGISRLWCYSPHSRDLKDLGVAVSILEQRRYGYEFGAAVVGRDGQIYFGENDNWGHIWIYFPRITAV